MTREDAAQLCAFVQEACPSQQMGEFAPDVWAEVMPVGYTLGECRAAVGVIIRRGERWADPGAIVAEVRRARADAAERERIHVLLDPAAYRAQVAATDAAFLAKLAARTGGRQLRALPAPDYPPVQPAEGDQP